LNTLKTIQIEVEINASRFQVAKDSTLEQALTEFNAKPPYAVLLNDQFLSNSLYPRTYLVEGDKIEVISAIQGG
jgi:sulfur carrier protein